MIPLDTIHPNVTRCQTCSRHILKPKRKCTYCKQTVYRTTTLPSSNKGRHKRGIALSKPDKIRTSRPKRQGVERMGNVPHLRTNEMYLG